jgi:hypothetical protein
VRGGGGAEMRKNAKGGKSGEMINWINWRGPVAAV